MTNFRTARTRRDPRRVAGTDLVATTTLDTPVGVLSIGATATGVRFVLWPGEGRSLDLGTGAALGAAGDARGTGDADDDVSRILELACTQLREYFAGDRREFDVPLDPVGTAFQQSAWRVLRTIPYAATMSYGEQARALGDPNKARAVGAANGRNPISIIVPCHRVVGSTGALTGFAGGLDQKAWLLDHERRVLATR
ncbi:MAG: methylated-DNA--[protein]-cysteine S-methyltransferase [Acidimicrobiales bacterium]|nr:methylated-DNA--[protein]-cysteine S-methyltransferase [Acidimicrobiales bacterium]MCB9393040.1 methylated-DNA--[protein]-cysteine S-methyltransferase [Acidimicrobiaceae bacterium]